MNGKLSICIPTYNRSDYLIECLKSFLPQLKKHNIPVYISDNASNDNTLENLKRFKKEKYQNIYIHSNEHNLGIDQNILKVVEMAQTEYVWLFSDDDIIKENPIDRILSELKKGYELIVLNASTFNFDFSQQREVKRIKINDKIYLPNEYENFIKEIGIYTTFLGSLVINKKKWSSVSLSKYKTSDFIHCWIIFNYIYNSKILFISKPFIKIRMQNASWSDRFFEVWYINWPKLIYALPNKYSHKTKNNITNNKNIYNLKLKYFLALRATNKFEKSTYNKYIKHKENYPYVKKVLVLFISFLPRLPLKFLYKFKLLFDNYN